MFDRFQNAPLLLKWKNFKIVLHFNLIIPSCNTIKKSGTLEWLVLNPVKHPRWSVLRCFQLLTIFAESSILDVWQGSKYTPTTEVDKLQNSGFLEMDILHGNLEADSVIILQSKLSFAMLQKIWRFGTNYMLPRLSFADPHNLFLLKENLRKSATFTMSQKNVTKASWHSLKISENL